MGKRRRDYLSFALAMLLLLSSALPWWVYGWCCFSQKSPAVSAVSVEEPKLIALTFDDGPRRSTTAALLDGLSQRGVHATFFLVGTNVEVNRDLVLRMDQEGHQLGVHSYHHKLLTELSQADFYEEVGALRALIGDIVGHEDALVLRPPYGKTDASVKALSGSPIILWSIDPEDWSDADTSRQVEHIVSRAQDGDIILLHDIYPSSVDTALQVVDALLADGFYFVTIDELFAAKGIELQNGQVYTCSKP
jgi:peptidoglycan/xylan/chitin deacetylase (PgdA/CDA1 family)